MTTLQNKDLFTPGSLVQHFKRETLSDEVLAAEPMMYLYEIVGIAEDTENGTEMMIYRALYGSQKMYARPLAMFLSPVDREKYPDIRQEYRFAPAEM
ncbi:MAG: DUF1653 domain-containing protein [Clostridia bacterium]|nr:DUF1653 domain-containing protein [Clostridia bacterium]